MLILLAIPYVVYNVHVVEHADETTKEDIERGSKCDAKLDLEEENFQFLMK